MDSSLPRGEKSCRLGRLGFLALALLVSFALPAGAQLDLPEWTAEEWERWQEETPPLGAFLFPGWDDVEERPELDPEELTEVPEEVPLNEENQPPREGIVEDLPTDLVESYFPESLEERLLDPQSLLTGSRIEGIHHFLDFHFREARSTIHILVLKPWQRVPRSINLRDIHQRWFGIDALAVLVVYNFGNPEMSRLVYGEEAELRVAEASRVRAATDAIDEAIVVGNAEEQLERFLTDLSRSLYLIEEEFHGEPINAAPQTAQEGFRQSLLAVTPPPRLPIDRSRLWLSVVAVIGILLVTGTGIGLVHLRAARKTYFFPERPMQHRLGCPHGGGNRLAVSFGSPKVPEEMVDPVNAGAGHRAGLGIPEPHSGEPR